jgi:phenylalanyl-tRNA synthetase alpha chain
MRSAKAEAAVEQRRAEVEAKGEEKLGTENVDVTLPAEMPADSSAPPRVAPPVHQRGVEDIFLGLGYEIVDDREVETTRYNFDALGFPEWHPARSRRASLYLTDETVMRTETSPAQIHKMERQRPPIYMLSIGRVYRRDTIDATHFPIFHQFEGLAIDKGITMADLKGTLLYVMRQIYGPEREVLFRTHYFPFTEPSMVPTSRARSLGGQGRCARQGLRLARDGRLGDGRPVSLRFVAGIPTSTRPRSAWVEPHGAAAARHPWHPPVLGERLRFLRQF